MKKLQVLIVLSCTLFCMHQLNGQTPDEYAKYLVIKGHQIRICANHRNELKKAFDYFQKAAILNNLDGMNASAIMLQNGYGVDQDQDKARYLFENAAAKGSGKAFYNLGLIYKFGYGVGMNYESAFKYFFKSAETGFRGGMYGVGYFYFKGLGVEQNYPLAVEWFEKGAALNRPSCKYQLGICYRNGYGVEKNLEKANEWLVAAALDGYDLAFDELLMDEEENRTKKGKFKSGEVMDDSSTPPQTYRQIKGVTAGTEFSGNWTGYLATYDYSGKFLVKKTPVKLQLKQSKQSFKGTWYFNDSIEVGVAGILTDSLLYFKNTSFEEPDRYNVNLNWNFTNGSIESYSNQLQTILAGNISLFSPDTKEPGRPNILWLSKEIENESFKIVSDSTLISDSINSYPVYSNTEHTKEVIQNHLIKKAQTNLQLKVYPNPFTNEITISGQIPNNGSVQIELYCLSGKKVYSSTGKISTVNYYSEKINPIIQPGNYLLVVRAGNQSKSWHVIKK